jgi:Uncharacterized protein conserved in bacteria
VQLVKVRLGILASVIVVVTMAGIFSVNNSIFDMWVLAVFGVIGYLMRKTGYEPGPLALAIVLGPLLETSFRQSMLLSGGSLSIFFTRPVPATVLCLVAAGGVFSLVRKLRKRGGSRVRGLGEFVDDSDEKPHHEEALLR